MRTPEPLVGAVLAAAALSGAILLSASDAHAAPKKPRSRSTARKPAVNTSATVRVRSHAASRKPSTTRITTARNTSPASTSGYRATSPSAPAPRWHSLIRCGFRVLADNRNNRVNYRPSAPVSADDPYDESIPGGAIR
jgi:hypothetical protein